jgi:hypothetical protein
VTDYRRRLDVNPDHIRVFMGALDWINRECSYAFPTMKAAQRFAGAHQERDPQRVIFVQEPVSMDSPSPGLYDDLDGGG